MDEEMMMKTLRAMAWQRAKGELQAYLETFWPEYDRQGKEIDKGFEDAQQRIEVFIREFEDNRR